MSIIDQLKKHAAKDRSYLYENRISVLKQNFNISHIEKAVDDVMNVLSKDVKSTVIYGEPQSGKTELMLALTCKLLDEGYETIFMVMNDNVSLEDQNFQRFAQCRELNPAPLKASEIISDPTSITPGKKHVIFCRKNKSILEKLIEATRKLGKRIVLDDEADFASPDNKINKPGDASMINQLVEKLIETKPYHDETQGIYIGVTATPGRLDLNNTFFNQSTEWIFVDPYPGYTGRGTFFPASRKAQENLPYNLKILPDAGERGDEPAFLRDAVLRFLLRNAYLSLIDPENSQPHSMLIHTSGKMEDHAIEKVQVQQIINKLKTDDEKLFQILHEFVPKIFTPEQLSKVNELDLLSFIRKNIGQTAILVINSNKSNDQNTIRAANPLAQFTFALGGNIISRGLTFNNLLSFFFTREVKGKLQQNTYIQRARMFGNRKNLEFFELSVPKSLWGNWIDCFQLHELALASAKDKDPKWFSNKKVNASDAGAINKNIVHVESGEIMVGEIFLLNDEIISVLEDNTKGTLQRIEELHDRGLISESIFPKSYLSIIKKYDDEEDSIHMVLSEGKSIRYIEPISGSDRERIYRQRGGIIASTINKIARYDNASHLIMPIRNSDDECRFYYKSNHAHVISSRKWTSI